MEKNNNFVNERESIEVIYPQMKDAKLLTREEELNVIERVKQDCPEAVEELKMAYICFVGSMAKRFLNNGLDKEKLLDAGMDGLVAAAHHYAPSSTFLFIPYAIWWIRRSIILSLKDSGSVEGKLFYQKEQERVAQMRELTSSLESGQLPNKIFESMKKLTSREYEIISLTYGVEYDKHSDEAICAKFGLTKKRLLLQRSMALVKLRRIVFG